MDRPFKDREHPNIRCGFRESATASHDLTINTGLKERLCTQFCFWSQQSSNGQQVNEDRELKLQVLALT